MRFLPGVAVSQDKSGAVLYYEQLGKIDDEAMKKAGLDSKQLLWHYMYQVKGPGSRCADGRMGHDAFCCYMPSSPIFVAFGLGSCFAGIWHRFCSPSRAFSRVVHESK